MAGVSKPRLPSLPLTPGLRKTDQMLTTKGIGNLDRFEIGGINRTGGAMVKGGVYALDITRTDATNSIDTDSSITSVVACATANLRGILVVALDAYAAAAPGRFLVRGLGKVMVDGTTDVLVGDRLIPQNASSSLIKMAANSLVNPCALALAGQTNDGALLTDGIYFDGMTWDGEKAVS